MHGVVMTVSLLVSATEPPVPVSNLDISSKTTTTVSLSWTYQFDESSPRTGVKIEVMKGNDLVSNITLPALATNTTLSSLEPLTMYIIAVYVINVNGPSRATILQTSTLSLSKFLLQEEII